jgi:hypothetical protein
LAGHCQLLQRVYFPKNQKSVLSYASRCKTQCAYNDENHNRIVETNPRVKPRIFAENVQKFYLGGASQHKDSDNIIIYESKDHQCLPMLYEYDMQIWNAHIYELNDEKYQKKILNALQISLETPP